MGKFFERPTNNTFNKLLNTSIITSVISLVIGIILIIFPLESIQLIGYITGGIFLINAFASGYKYFKRDGALLYRYNIVFMILEIILGIIIIVVPKEVSAVVTKIFGVFMIIFGANKISYGVWFRIGNELSWLLTITVGIMLLLFGIIMLFYPFTNIALTMLIGIFTAVNSILDIINTALIKKRAGDIITIFW